MHAMTWWTMLHIYEYPAKRWPKQRTWNNIKNNQENTMIPGSRTCASSCASGSASSTAVRSPAAAADTRRKSSGRLLTSKVCATVGPPPESNNDGSRKAQEADRSNGPAFENSRGPRHIWGRHNSSGFIHRRTSYDFLILCYDLPWSLLESFNKFSHRTWIIYDTWYFSRLP